MENNDKVMKNIEKLGERYCEKYIAAWDKKKLKEDWWEALKFFFSHSFMRGRRDKLSNEYYYFTLRVLQNYFSITNTHWENVYKKVKEQREYFNKECILKFKEENDIKKGNSVKHLDFREKVAEKNPIIKTLVAQQSVEIEWEDKTYHKRIFLGNDEDIMMVLDVLKFISDDNKKNIYSYLTDTMKNQNRGVKSTYEELVKIRAISDKIASFIIRDIGLMNPEIRVPDEDYKWAFPIDTWVMKIAHKLGCSSDDIKAIKDNLIKKCKESDVEILKVAAGLWFLGFHSLDILLEDCLDKVEIGGITSSNSE